MADTPYRIRVTGANPYQLRVTCANPYRVNVTGTSPFSLRVLTAAQGPQGVVGPPGPQGEAGAGVTMLHQLSDTAILDPLHLDQLSYDQFLQKWVNRPEQAILDGGNF